MREQTNKILKTLCIYMLVISMMLSSVAGSWQVMAAGIEAPKIDPVSIGATVVTGKGLIKRGQRNKKNAVCNIIVTVKDADGGVKETKTFSIQPTEKDPKGSVWSVTLDNPVQEGYKVYAKQELVGTTTETSEEVSVEAKKLLADQHKDTLKMPTGEIWIEQTSSNQVNEDEQAEAVELFNNVNTAIAGDIKSVKFSINTAEHAYYEVTYRDNSTSGKIEATKLTIKQVTDYSQAPTIEKTYVADGKITITLGQEIAKGTKIGVIQTIDRDEVDKFCSDKEDSCASGKCKITKSTVTWVTADNPTKTFTYSVSDDFLELGKDFGVIVKEPHKFASCKKTEPKLKIPNVGVRDPKKLTETEKDKIREEIRKANTTTDGTSKLPDWKANNVPAIIDFDKDGNVNIINPANVEGDWFDDYTKFVPKRNDDGSIIFNVGKKPEKTVKPEEVLNNLPPKAPEVKVEGGKVIVTPNKADTDARTVAVTYTGKDGKEKKLQQQRAKMELGLRMIPK